MFQPGRREEKAARLEESLRNGPQGQGGILTSLEALLAASAGDDRKAEKKIKRAAEIGKNYHHFNHTALNDMVTRPLHLRRVNSTQNLG